MEKTAAQEAYYKFASSRNWTDDYEEAGWHVPKATRRIAKVYSDPLVQGALGASVLGSLGAEVGHYAYKRPGLGALIGALGGGALGAGFAYGGSALGRRMGKKRLAEMTPESEATKPWYKGEKFKRNEDLTPEEREKWWS